ncbi:DEAD/DEAH box helicase [Moorena sp. SIO3I8]|uniref:DEAD/DEAH box helicase n=1 Tax=Moorena sp. SIO3I8 TaxID=2607833 RepID=UPI0013C143DD|nr:DEAD/DEAH box helicase [Moorena sp. SIO3I8]NEO07803.1 DEAD/DEAH box helicase [Moorena sp. SIO3I8]
MTTDPGISMAQSIDIQQPFYRDLNSEISLRNYQEELVFGVFEEWRSGKRRVMVQLPTGGGKTVCIGALVQYFVQQGLKVLAIAHRKELITQLSETLENITKLPIGKIKAGIPPAPQYNIQVASIQTLIRRQPFPEADLLIIDEAHHSASRSYTDVMSAYPDAYIAGFTATPTRTDGHGFLQTYDALVKGVTTAYLIEHGYLSQFKVYGGVTINTKGLKSSVEDYQKGALEKRAMAVVGDVVPAWKKHALGKKTIVFAVGVKHSQAIAAAFNNEGITAEHLDGKTSAGKREEALERFRNGKTTILSNCGLFGEGVDIPSIEAVQICRPTVSKIVHFQQIGRALRPSPGKTHAVIIDHSENWRYHGLPDTHVEWSLEPISIPNNEYATKCSCCGHCFLPFPHDLKTPIRLDKDKDGNLTPIYHITCPSCLTTLEYIKGAGAAIEPDEEAGGEKERLEGLMMEIVLEANPEYIKEIDQAIAKQTKNGYKRGWVFHHLLKEFSGSQFSVGDWRYVAHQLGYELGWANYAWRDSQVFSSSEF